MYSNGNMDKIEVNKCSGKFEINATNTPHIKLFKLNDMSNQIILYGTIDKCEITNCNIENIEFKRKHILLCNIDECYMDNICLKSTVSDTVGMLAFDNSTVNRMVIKNSSFIDNASNSSIISATTGGKVLDLFYDNCKILGTNLYMANTDSSYTGKHKLTLKDCDIVECKRLIDNPYYYNLDIFVYNTTINSTLEMIYFSREKDIRIFGDNMHQEITFAGTPHVYCYGQIPVDLSKITKAAMGRAYNTNSSLSCGVGYCICDGSNWKNMFNGNTY